MDFFSTLYTEGAFVGKKLPIIGNEFCSEGVEIFWYDGIAREE